MDKNLFLYEPFDNLGSTINGAKLNIDSAFTNEAKKQKGTDLWTAGCVSACTCRCIR